MRSARDAAYMAPSGTMTVEIDRGSDPISGHITDDRGTRPFSGWLELASALQALVELHDSESVG